MYSSSETSTRIKKLAKEKGLQMFDLQERCGLSKNTIAQSGKSQDGMKAKNLYAIAELLECSVDYLLGRTDIPTSTYSISNNNTTVNGTQANVINNSNSSDGLTEQFMRAFEELSFEDKVSVMQFVKEIKKSPSDDSDEE